MDTTRRRVVALIASSTAVSLAGHLSHEHHPLLAAAWRADLLEWGGAVGVSTCVPTGVVVHHTATGADAAGDDAMRIDGFHRSRGFCTFWGFRSYHIGYHYVVRSDGVVESGRPERCQGAHAGSLEANRRLLGVAVAGDFGQARDLRADQFGSVQLLALRSLVRDICRRYGIDRRSVLPHRALVPATECPGQSFPWEAFVASL